MERLAATARRRAGRKVTVLAAEVGIAVPTVTQHAHFLRLAGLLARRAPVGALRLARAPAEISLLDVIRAIDGGRLWKRCLFGLAQCSDASPCPVHPVWKEARALLEEHLAAQSLADLVRSVEGRRRERAGARGARRHPARAKPSEAAQANA